MLVVKLIIILLVCMKFIFKMKEWWRFLIICIGNLNIWFEKEIGSIIFFKILSFWLDIFLINEKLGDFNLELVRFVLFKNDWLIYEMFVFVLIKVKVLVFLIEICIVFFLICWVKLIEV